MKTTHRVRSILLGIVLVGLCCATPQAHAELYNWKNGAIGSFHSSNWCKDGTSCDSVGYTTIPNGSIARIVNGTVSFDGGSFEGGIKLGYTYNSDNATFIMNGGVLNLTEGLHVYQNSANNSIFILNNGSVTVNASKYLMIYPFATLKQQGGTLLVQGSIYAPFIHSNGRLLITSGSANFATGGNLLVNQGEVSIMGDARVSFDCQPNNRETGTFRIGDTAEVEFRDLGWAGQMGGIFTIEHSTAKFKSGSLTLGMSGANVQYNAPPQTTFTIGSGLSFANRLVQGDGLENTHLIFDIASSTWGRILYNDAAQDKGCTPEGFVNNNAIGKISVRGENPYLQIDEVLYVHDLYIPANGHLNVGSHGKLRYAKLTIESGGQFTVVPPGEACQLPEENDLRLETGPQNPVGRPVKVNAERKAVVNHLRLNNNADTAATLSRLTYTIQNGPFLGTEARLFRDAACDGTPDADDLIGIVSPLDTTTIGFPVNETLVSGRQTCYLLEFGWQRLTDVPFSLSMGASIGPEQVIATLNGSAADCGGATVTGTIIPADLVVNTAGDEFANITGDEPDGNPGDGLCSTGREFALPSGEKRLACTLRAALQEANALPGKDELLFAIAERNHDIPVASPLPQITDPIAIIGSTQTGDPVGVCASRIGTPNHGLHITAGDSTVEGLFLGGFNGHAILLEGPGGNVIRDNYIGMGMFDSQKIPCPNTGSGVYITNSANNELFGNYLSGNRQHGLHIFGAQATDNLAYANYIGVGWDPVGIDVVGFVGDDLRNTDGILIEDAPGTLIRENVISHNRRNGIHLKGVGATNTKIRGNFIGVNQNGTMAKVTFGNGGNGIFVEQAPGNLIGGVEADARNIVAHNEGSGVLIYGPEAAGNKVQGNFIGVDGSARRALPNFEGVYLWNAPGNLIGGATAAARNIISGNYREGVKICYLPECAVNVPFDPAATTVPDTAPPNTIQGNFIGPDDTGTTRPTGNYGGKDIPMGNAKNGIKVHGADRTVIGGANAADGNLLAFNGDHEPFGGGTYSGIALVDANRTRIEHNQIAENFRHGMTVVSGTGNLIRANAIYLNKGLGIDLGARYIADQIPTTYTQEGDGVTLNDAGDNDSGPNGFQNYPVIDTANQTGNTIAVTGTLSSKPATPFELEFFCTMAEHAPLQGDMPQGDISLGAEVVTTDASGNAAVTFTTAALAEPCVSITATAIDPDGNTSEFSVVSLVVNVTGDDADADPADGVLDVDPATPGRQISLRAALDFANDTPGKEHISFAIPGGGIPVITPATPLPSIMEAVVLDGLTQPGGRVKLDGTYQTGEHGIDLAVADGTEITGLIIENFPGDGIHVVGSEVSLTDVSVLRNRQHGVWFAGPDRTLTIAGTDNRFNNHPGSGILLASGTILAHLVEALDNGGWGIAAMGEDGGTQNHVAINVQETRVNCDGTIADPVYPQTSRIHRNGLGGIYAKRGYVAGNLLDVQDNGTALADLSQPGGDGIEGWFGVYVRNVTVLNNKDCGIVAYTSAILDDFESCKTRPSVAITGVENQVGGHERDGIHASRGAIRLDVVEVKQNGGCGICANENLHSAGNILLNVQETGVNCDGTIADPVYPQTSRIHRNGLGGIYARRGYVAGNLLDVQDNGTALADLSQPGGDGIEGWFGVYVRNVTVLNNKDSGIVAYTSANFDEFESCDTLPSVTIAGMENQVAGHTRYGVYASEEAIRIDGIDAMENGSWGIRANGGDVSINTQLGEAIVPDHFSSIRQNRQGGILVSQGSLDAVHLAVVSNGGDGIRAKGETIVRSSDISCNTGYGVVNVLPGGTTIQAVGNWWGDPSGPGGSGPGQGEEISSGVSIAPWQSIPFVTRLHRLTVAATPSGAGSVTGNDGRIACGSNCEWSYYCPGAQVELTANAADGMTFIGWEGALSGTDNPASIAMNEDKRIVARFGSQSGNGDTDGDGVPDASESGPGGDESSYDGDENGVPDYQEAGSASLSAASGDAYATLAVPNGSGLALNEVTATGNPSPGNLPDGIEFPYGFFGFRTTAPSPGGCTGISLYLPRNESIDTYYKYGRTPDYPTPRWYEFSYDGRTGAQIFHEAERTRIVLHLCDGERGDEDLTINGQIAEPGGPGIVRQPQQPIPSLTEWGAVLLVLSMILAGALLQQRKDRKSGT